jgi:FkbM family methyltransferase
MIGELTVDTFFTPRHNPVTMMLRPDTTDWNTVNACITADEYGLADRAWSGVAIDVGAHIGGVTCALLADNPDLFVIAIEALPMNVEALRTNVSRNGFDDRCEVIEAAADSGSEPVTVAYGTTEGEFETAHRFIGGAIWQDTGPKGTRVVQRPVSLADLTRHPIALVKIDCEGCEWSFLDDPLVGRVEEIRGEYHPRGGNGPARIRELLEPTHIVTLDDAEPFGPFRAVRR